MLKLSAIKPASSWAVVLLCIAASFSLASCSGDEPGESDLYGTWQDIAFIYHFGSDGKGYFQDAPTNGGYDIVGDVKSYFTWTASPTILSITYDGSGTVNAHTSTFYYEVDDKLLVMIDIESGDTHSYTKR